MKGRIHSLLKPANAFGVERGMDTKTKKEWKGQLNEKEKNKLEEKTRGFLRYT